MTEAREAFLWGFPGARRLNKRVAHGRATLDEAPALQDLPTDGILPLVCMPHDKGPHFTDDGELSGREQFLSSTFGPRAARWILALFEIVQVGVLSLALVMLVRTFIVQPFYVKGASMEPNFLDHEYLLIDEVSYRFREPQRGEIIVFRYPRNPREFFIKRVIGLPNDTVEVHDGHVRITNDDHPQGFDLTESYLHGVETLGERRLTLASREYFVLGDNRGASLDSRIFGPVPQKDFIGRVWVRGWPLDRITKFEPPSY